MYFFARNSEHPLKTFLSNKANFFEQTEMLHFMGSWPPQRYGTGRGYSSSRFTYRGMHGYCQEEVNVIMYCLGDFRHFSAEKIGAMIYLVLIFSQK
jgi:hypothetical protein